MERSALQGLAAFRWGALAGVPTWARLTLGGSILLGIGVALERSDTSPVEAGRRIVDVVGERFG